MGLRQFALDAAREVRHESDMRVSVGAALVKGNRILGLAANKSGKSPCHGTWSRHAEVRATLNKDAKGASVYVYREHGLSGKPLLAKPCASCIEWLRGLGVKRVFYTHSQGVQEMRL